MMDSLSWEDGEWATEGVWFNWRDPSTEGGHPLGPDQVKVWQCIRRMNLLMDLELPFYVKEREKRSDWKWSTQGRAISP